MTCRFVSPAIVLSIQNRPISHTANTGTDLVLFRSLVGRGMLSSILIQANPYTITLGLDLCVFSKIVVELGKKCTNRLHTTRLLKRESYHTHTSERNEPCARCRGRCFCLGGCRLGGEMFIEMNKSIERGLNLSRS